MRSFLFVGLAVTLSTLIALADVGIEIQDLSGRVMRVSYRMEITPAFGDKKFFVFPDDGFTFAKDSIHVVQVREVGSKQDLKWSVVPAANDPNYSALRVSYPNPKPTGKFTVDLVVEAVTKNIETDASGRYVFKYTTSHRTAFLIPDGHSLVYTSMPAQVREADGKTVVLVVPEKQTELVFKTRKVAE